MVRSQAQTEVATHLVKCERKIAASADAVWALLGDFFTKWHPAIEWIRKEEDGLTRCFKVKGEDSLYRERLKSISADERVLQYEHIEGILAVHRYKASCLVEECDDAAQVVWTAEIEADEPRAKEISEGTRAVFQSGLDEIAAIFAISEIVLPGSPKLSLSLTVPREGPFVLFLHGIGGNRCNWRGQLFAVAPHVQAAAMDFRGYGESELGGSQSTVADYCADILRVMHHLGKSSVILCGLSYGSWIATSFAMRHPGKLSGLILSGGCTGMSEAGEAERSAFLTSRMKPLNEGKSPADFAKSVVDAIAGPKANMEVRKQLLDSMAKIAANTYRDAVTCFCSPPEKFNFAAITCPVLLMTGQHDRLASPTEIKGVADHIRASRGASSVQFGIIADAGHVCNLEQPKRYNDLLVSFLKGISK